MVEETTHALSEQLLSSQTPKKRAPRRRRPSTKLAATKVTSSPKIDECLSAIYQDENGAMPDMRTITVEKNHPIRNFFARIFVYTIVLCILGWVGWYFWPTTSVPGDNSATIAIAGPDHPPIGSTITYTVTYQNNSNAAIDNALLQIFPPKGFVVNNTSVPADNANKTEWSLGTLPAQSHGTISITGKIYGTPNQSLAWKSFLNFKTNKVTTALQKTTSLPIVLGPSPFTLSIAGPSPSPLGVPTNYTLKIQSSIPWPTEPLEIIPDLPDTFNLTSSSPALNKNNHWFITAATSSAKNTSLGTIFVNTTTTEVNLAFTGEWSNSTTTDPMLRARLVLTPTGESESYVVANIEQKNELVKNDVSLLTAINGTIGDFDSKPGELLNTTIQLKNNSARDIKNAAITLTFDAPSLKRQSILNWAGIINPTDADIHGEQISDTRRRGSLLWTTKYIKGLSKINAGKDITIDLRIPINNGKNFDLSSLKETTILVKGTATFTDENGSTQTVATTPIIITLNSDLSFEQRSKITMDNGQKNFALTWVLTNNFHPLKNIELSGSLFGNINWKASEIPSSGQLNFDEKEKKLTWNIKELPTSVDVATAPFAVTVLKDNPTQSLLMSKIRIHAEDTVTGKTIELLGDETPLQAQN